MHVEVTRVGRGSSFLSVQCQNLVCHLRRSKSRDSRQPSDWSILQLSESSVQFFHRSKSGRGPSSLMPHGILPLSLISANQILVIRLTMLCLRQLERQNNYADLHKRTLLFLVRKAFFMISGLSLMAPWFKPEAIPIWMGFLRCQGPKISMGLGSTFQYHK